MFSGGFPFFPWITFFILGTISYEFKIFKKSLHFSIVFLLVAFIVVSIKFHRLIPITKYPASLSFNIISLSGCCLLNYILFYIQDIKNYFNSLFYPFGLFGKLSLTIFMGHIIIGYEIIKLLPFQINYYYNFFLIMVFTYAIILIITYIWQKKSFKYSLEWILIKITYPLLKPETESKIS